MLSATASHHGGIAAAAIIITATIVTLGYFVACAVWPYASCVRCDGNGKFRSPSGKAWRNCPRCKGTGRRVRYGRRIHTSLTKTKRKEGRANRSAERITRRITDRNDT